MSARFYRACLRAYPRSFRDRYADDMTRVFDARIRRARERGIGLALALALFCAADALLSGARERFGRRSVVPAPRSPRMNTLSWIADARLAWRVIRRTPIISGAAIVTIALGLGASGAIFAAVDHVLLQPLPYTDPDGLVMVWSNNTREGQDRNSVSPADALDFQHESQSFVGLEPMLSFLVSDQYVDGPRPDSIRSFSVAPGMFALLGRSALVGRTFDASAPAGAASHEVILSYDFWQRRYGGDRGVIGRQVTISGTSNYTVVGVMPESFVFPYRSMLGPSGYVNASTADVWVPMYFNGGFYVDASGQPVRQLRALALVGRLKPGVSVEGARSDLAGVASRLAALYPTSNDGWTTTVVPLLDQTVGSLRPALRLLLAGVGILFLMTLANVANLLLAQALGRHREVALRAALGASRLRLARQAIVESLILMACGGVAGTLLLYVGVPLIVAAAPVDMPRLAEIRPDAPVFAFALALTLISGVLVGLVPALLAAGRDASASLKDGARGSTSGPAARRMRAVLVGAEIVLAVLLTSASLLLARSFLAVLDVDPGFRADHLLTFQLNVPSRIVGVPARLAYYDDLFGRLTAIPGVVAAGGTTRLPLGSTNVSTRIAIEGRDIPQAALPEIEFRRGVSDYFAAMDIPILRGRDFTPSDDH